MPQVITITLDASWQFITAWTDRLGHRMAEFKDGAGDRIIFEIVDKSAAEAFLEAARAVQ
ncbi:MAG: hypothetical protein WC600_17015 [Desulfobaccales bacterium]